MTYIEKEVTPATILKAQKVADLLLEAQLIANELIANDILKVLKVDGLNIDYCIMQTRHQVLDYRNQLVDVPSF